MTRQRKTASDRARELRAKHPEWSLQQIADECGIAKQSVAYAIARPGKRGRPRLDPAERVARAERELAEARKLLRT